MDEALSEKVKSDFKVCIDKITDDKDFAIEGWCQGEDAERDNASERYLLLRSEQGKIYQCKMEKYSVRMWHSRWEAPIIWQASAAG